MEFGLALLPFIAYFLLITALLATVSRPIYDGFLRAPSQTSLHLAIATVSLAVTWYYMLQYFLWSYSVSGAPTINQWLNQTSLFSEAWGIAVEKGPPLWIAEQLCAWTMGGWFILMSQNENPKRKWAFMLLGQVTAISFAQALYFAASATNQAPRLHQRMNKGFILALGAATMTVGYLPFSTGNNTFLPNLLIMHMIGILALVPSSKGRYLAARYAYLLSVTVSLINHLRSTKDFQPANLSRFYQVQASSLFSHPAKASIGCDVLLTSIGFWTWATSNHSNPLWLMMLTLTLPVLGIAPSGALYLYITS